VCRPAPNPLTRPANGPWLLWCQGFPFCAPVQTKQPQGQLSPHSRGQGAHIDLTLRQAVRERFDPRDEEKADVLQGKKDGMAWTRLTE
jgi:hypothetical protein